MPRLFTDKYAPMIHRWCLRPRQETFILVSDFRAFALTLFILLHMIPRLNAQHTIAFEGNVAVKMRDGVILRADVYHPNVEGKFPVLLQRTPYNKDQGVAFGIEASARGYVVIFQDV
jgi:predicted acyl esterase